MTSTSPPEMQRLVDRTRGYQPARRLFHALNGVLVAVALTALDLPRLGSALLLGGAFLLLLVLDLVRLRVPALNRTFFRLLRPLASPREAEGIASSTWYALGIALAVALFPLPLAVSGILVMALADPTASYLGQRFGRRPFLGGSVEGSAVFLLTALLVLALRHPLPVALPAALVATLAERLSWPLDDNLVLPPATAGALALAGWLL